ncbi:hypothetical protein OF83DRAFT_1179533 [Amylostereum chailletii]|nr:hypothetical protein OF83DRAFT_1179533 [Amylostereum chailletii]
MNFGAVFAPLVLSGVGPRAPTSPAGNGTTPAGGGTSNASSHPHTAAIAGGVVGGVLGSVVLVGLALWFWRRYKRTRLAYSSGNTSAQSIPEPEPFTMHDAHSQGTSTGSPTVLSPKGLLALRHTTRLTYAVTMAQVPEDRPPVTAPSREHVILDPRVDELRREMDVLRLRAERAEPPPSYVDE